MSITLAGVMPPVPTPFDGEGEIAPKKLAENITQLKATGLSGFVILGSNGEYVYLDDVEKLALFEAAREVIPAELLFIAGTGAESTRAAVRLTLAAAHLGADAAIVITPAYYKPAMTDASLQAHFFSLAESSPIPIIIYNMPAYTGLDLSAGLCLKLAEHPNIIGLKESSGNIVKIAEIVAGATERGLHFEVLAGSASFLQATLAVGGSGGVAAVANVAPRQCVQIYQQMQAGNIAEATRLQHAILALNGAVTSRYGVAGLKYALDKLGMYGGAVRPPLLPIAKATEADLDALLATQFDTR